jgi:hypothetical protein
MNEECKKVMSKGCEHDVNKHEVWQTERTAATAYSNKINLKVYCL